ncbi:MAG: hydantoinase/oxoprolinase family protein [Gammaproteobacteria bacterium]|nr:hydantoinase/oxoprolinase family protein [Gammaproteobacteria bacterium]
MLTVGIDVGGTFTDVFVRDTDRDGWIVHKVPSTPPAFGDGFMRGLTEAVATAGAAPESVHRVVHGTTVATNCILTQSGARLGFLLTEGCRDILYIGIGWRPKMYDLDMDPVEPLFLAPRRRSLEVIERLDYEGNVLTPLDEDNLRQVAKTLVEEHGVEVFVVCLLHSYANPQHERRCREILNEMYPDVPVTLSSDVLPRRREYRRLVVSGFDGYVKPVVTNYLNELVDKLAAASVRAPLHVMQSHGGVGGVENVIERPVGTVLSGLAAGVIGAANVGASAGFPDCISLDMGGTSTDVALIRAGQPLITNEGSFEDYPLNVPMIDVRTIGAGGSSIAHVDEGGALKVGPESAGANPGPACYGRGGKQPTVTDASLVLGYLNPETFAGGLDIDVELSRKAIENEIAEPLGMSLLEAALGMHAIVNSNMAQTLRLVSIKRGHDPRDFVLIPFGGAGPLQGGRLAENASIHRILVPPTPGVLSAMGLMLAPIQHEALASFEIPATEVTLEKLQQMFAPLDEQNSRKMTNDGVDSSASTTEYFAEIRYVGQSHQLEVSMGSSLNADSAQNALDLFNSAHLATYNHNDPGAACEFVMLRSVHSKEPEEKSLLEPKSDDGTAEPPFTKRQICLSADTGYEDVPIYQRADLPVGFELAGPAIVEQADTTTLIYRDHAARVDEYGNLVIDLPR